MMKNPKTNYFAKIIVFTALTIFILNAEITAATFIRVNQLGYGLKDTKIAVVISDDVLDGTRYTITNSDGKSIYSGALSKDSGVFLNFDHHYHLDFTNLKKVTNARIEVNDSASPVFRIAPDVYDDVVDSLLKFYQIQRCGNTRPVNHLPCHLHDVSRIIGGPRSGKKLDLTGGWHDAGDYPKFLNTAAYTTYLLLLTHQMNPNGFTDRDRNGRDDLLDEIRIGLDWLQRMHYQKDRLLIQVRSEKDHDVGWRLPENDALSLKRYAWDNPSKTHCGVYSAAMALGYVVFKKAGDTKYAKSCLKHAVQVWDLAYKNIPANSSGPDSTYFDSQYWDNLALAGVELYRATGKKTYLKKALELVKDKSPVYWISWGDLDGLAYARLAGYSKGLSAKLDSTLNYFQMNSEKNPFGYPLTFYPWGSASIQVGVAMLSVLYQEATGSDKYLNLAVNQRDFVLGKNSHGVSFISEFGTDYSRNFHHQIAYLKGIPLTGGFAAGFVSAQAYESSQIELESFDRFSLFQNEDVVYYDDRNDYLSNEASIANNAQTLFVFAWFAAGAKK